MPQPEGYRKVERLAHLASRLGLPIVTFVDTKGADPGIASEEHAQSEAIAMCLQAFAVAKVPIVATVIGEGGSGGALALAIADRVIMLEHSTYSVASPEGCAAILWSDATKAEEAASRLKLTAQDLEQFGVIDEIVPEPFGGAHRDPTTIIANRPRDGIVGGGTARADDAAGFKRGSLSEVSPDRRMGNGASGRHRATTTVKRRTRASLIMRFLGRVGATTLALLVFTLVAIQFARVIHQNISLRAGARILPPDRLVSHCGVAMAGGRRVDS